MALRFNTLKHCSMSEVVAILETAKDLDLGEVTAAVINIARSLGTVERAQERVAVREAENDIGVIMRQEGVTSHQGAVDWLICNRNMTLKNAQEIADDHFPKPVEEKGSYEQFTRKINHTLRPFDKHDWYGFAGCEKFDGGGEPMIADLTATSVIVVDRNGISVTFESGEAWSWDQRDEDKKLCDKALIAIAEGFIKARVEGPALVWSELLASWGFEQIA